jgi:5-methylcytosine-specific restriction endonuclease McrA
MPCTTQRAYELLRRGRAAIYRHVPFTIIIRAQIVNPALQPIELRIDPGSKTTGIALVANGRVIVAAELAHRGAQIRKALQQRAAYRRRRRSQNLRYRKARFDNSTRRDGWLPPSLQSRVDNVLSWAQRCARLCSLTSMAVETVRFDTQLFGNPNIAGAQYQQGTMAGYEVREYLLEKWVRRCAYCDAKDVPLQIEHVVPKSGGGSNRISNLTLACKPCNDAKDNYSVDRFLAHDPRRLASIHAQLKTPLRDAAAVNATRYAIGRALETLRVPVTFWSGGRTKFNRCAQNYPKTHWIDAACVGEHGASVRLDPKAAVLRVKATGRGARQVRRTDAYGFPRGRAKRVKNVRGFRSGDFVRLVQPSGKYAGIHVGRIAVRERGVFDIATPVGKITAPATRFTLLQRNFGYALVA